MSETDGVCVSRLIALVRDRPVLWDRQEEVYKNRKLTKKAWAEICEALLDNYYDLVEEDQKAFGRSVIGKWANLRDNWLRYWRKRQDHLRTGSSTNRFKTYIHHEQLMFLSKVYNDQSEMQQEVEEIQVDVDVLSDPGTESPLGYSSEEVSQTPWNFSLSSEEPSQTPWSLPLAEDKPEEPPPPLTPQTEERHLYFFQSTLPLIADFDENQVLDFHAAVLESIKRVKNGRNLINIMPTHQPAYILAIAQPQGFLANTEVKPKVLAATNPARQFSDPSEQTVTKREPGGKCSSDVTSAGTQTSSGSKQPQEEGDRTGTNSALISPTNISTLTDLKSVVNKLDEISKKFETTPFEDSYDKFGKYVGSFLRSLPLKKAQLLKRRIVRQILKLQLIEKRNSNHLHKPAEKHNPNESLHLHCRLSPQTSVEVGVTNEISTTEEKVATPSSMKNTSLNKNKKHSKTHFDESSMKAITDKSKPNGNSVGDCPMDKPTSPSHVEPRQFACDVCACVCVSSSDLHSHCAIQHKGYSPSFKRKAEPVKRGRRGRKKKVYNNAEVAI